MEQSIYLWGDPTEALSWKALLNLLPAPAREHLFEVLEATQGVARFAKQAVRLKPWEHDVFEEDAVVYIRSSLSLAAELAETTETAWRSAVPLPDWPG